MTETLVEVEDLNVWFDLPNGRKLHAVQGVSFSVAAGTRLGMVGESGCGKTTTILALMGLLPSTASVSGRIALEGVDILERGEQTLAPHRWKDIAMVFQGAMNAFDPVRRIGEQIAEPMELHGSATGREATARVGELLETVGISPDRARSYPHELSGGMRQRAAIAMALACSPRILLADEPTTALDVMVQAQILELLTYLSDELGLALVLVTHDLPIVAQTCTHAAVMYAGKIVERGPTDALYHDARHPYTRLLWAATPDLESRDDVVSIPGVPPRLDAELHGCPFAPRCDRAASRCEDERPELRRVGEAHVSACHFATSLEVVA
jgi:peptide/nickel transport system ATP-binding protein